jgi:hypothetical protein
VTVAAIACADRAPTAATPIAAAPDLSALHALPTITLGYVCGSTFRVDMRTPAEPVMLFSHSTPGVVKYPFRGTADTYVVGGINETTRVASATAGIFRETGIIASLSVPSVHCGYSRKTPPPGAVKLFYVCQRGWGVRNRSRVPYRLRWKLTVEGPSYNIDVPAASATAPAELFFAHTDVRLAPMVLRDATGEHLIELVTPKHSEFGITCRNRDLP